MSRDLYRVPLDFEWPIRKVWDGYLMPKELHALDCSACAGTSYSETGRLLKDRWYGYAPFKPEDRGSTPLTVETPAVRAFADRNVLGSPDFYGRGEYAIAREAQRLAHLWNAQWCHHLNQDDVDALIEAGRLYDLTHEWKDGKWIPTGHHPTAAEVNIWSIGGWGHDSINQWVAVRAECKRLGVEEFCAACDGNGGVYRDDAHRAAHEAWERTEPPKGDGFQMWETTSEGSPISPVFDAPENLARWLANTNASAFGSEGATYEQWLRMIGVGHSLCSAVTIDNGFMISGVAAV